MTEPERARTWLDPARSLAGSPAAKYLSSLGTGSRRTVQQCLASLAELVVGQSADPIKLRWEMLHRTETVALRTKLKEKFAPATANKMLSVLRGVLRTARDMGLMTEGAFQTAASLEMVKAAAVESGTPLTPKILVALFKGCSGEAGAAGRRDAALLAIFLCSGLRRAEAAALDISDYDCATGRLHIRGERPEYDRLVMLPKPAREAVSDWLQVRSSEPGPLLLPVDRGGLIRFRRMTDQAIYDIFHRIVDRAGVPTLTLRDLRRAYLVSLIRLGKSVATVQYLVKHTSWFSTAAYQTLAADAGHPSYVLEKLPYQKPKGVR